MNQSPELIVYRASAGSGKTFTLAVEYIKLLIKNPWAYRNILAVTFTNKATGEMKERILSQLYGIWKQLPDSQGYIDRVCNDLNLSPTEVSTKAGIAMNNILHDYSFFRVETIDSFFQSVMRNLARELRLGANLNIELNSEDALQKAVDGLIDKLTDTSQNMFYLLEFIEQRISQDKSWNVAKDVKQFGMNIFKEEYVTQGEKLREQLNNAKFIQDYIKALRSLDEEMSECAKGFKQQFTEEMARLGVQETDLKGGRNNVLNYFEKLINGDWDKLHNTTNTGYLTSADNWILAKNKNAAALLTAIKEYLKPILDDADRWVEKAIALRNTIQLASANLYSLGLLSSIYKELREQNLMENRFLLSETNALIHSLVNRNDSSFVFEKIGCNIHNIMIDEFQDTSKMQWDNFRILLLEGLSQGANSMIVGDVKQSIYRWRSGDWRILNGMRGQLDNFPIREEKLDTNRRSAGNIIEFNNKLFTNIINALNEEYKADYNHDCEEMLFAYSDVEQKKCKDPDKGYVEVNVLGKKADISYADDTAKQLVEQVNRLVAQGIAPNDIAILVRRNSQITSLAEYFSLNSDYDLISDEAFMLSASVCLQILIEALRYLNDRTNKLALAKLAQLYVDYILLIRKNLNEILLNEMEQSLPEAYIKHLDELSMLPLYELTEELFNIFNLSIRPKDASYLCTFYDAMLDFTTQQSSDISSFLTYWDDELNRKTIPAGVLDGIHIMSVHKSKGLEFHTVIIPYCDWELETSIQHSPLLWCIPQTKPFNNISLLPIKYNKIMMQSVFDKEYHEERLQLWIDSMNILYVALTRPTHNLILYIADSKSGSICPYIKEAAASFMEEIETEHNEDSKYFLGELYTDNNQNGSQTKNVLLQKPERLLLSINPTKVNVEFKQSNRSAEFINGEVSNQETFIRQGELLHNLFAHIQTLSDIAPAIERLRFEGILGSQEEVNRVQKLTEWAMKHPQVSQWFGGEYKVYNECTILIRDKEGLPEIQRPDRVMIKDNEVVVVDFKFGNKQQKYHEQVKRYMHLLKEMGHQNVSGYLWYVYKNELEEVIYG